MTREEAIARIKGHMFIHKMNEPRAIHISEALDMAIKALEKEPCEDAISRQAAIDALQGLPTWWADEGGYYGGAQPPMVALLDPEDAVSAIENLPSVTPQPKVGKWIAVENEEMKTVGYYCSECDLPMETEQRTNFCPNCGTKMVESQESEE